MFEALFFSLRGISLCPSCDEEKEVNNRGGFCIFGYLH